MTLSKHRRQKCPDNIIQSTIEGNERLIDYAMVNDRCFINITSLGFDAEVAYQARRFKKLPLYQEAWLT